MGSLSDPERVLVFLLVCACLGACFVAALWELEQARRRWHARLTAFRRTEPS
jgi:hypothetical protein